MRKTSKRIISLILCMAMIFSMGIVNISAAEEEQTQTGSYNLLINPGAEDVDTTAGTITGWTLGNKATYQTNNPVTGTYGFKLNNSGDYVQQTVTVPETTTYKLTGWLTGMGTLGVYDADGNVIASVERSEKSYAMLSIESISLEAGQKVIIKLTRGSSWLNADDLVFASTATYEWVAAEKVISNIAAIAGVEGTTSFLGAVLTARESYEGLSDEAKAGVTNYDDLLDAEAKIDYMYSEHNLLINPDFEYGSGTVGSIAAIIPGWTKNSCSWANNNAYSGDYHWALSASTSAYISQEVVIPETTTYKLTGYISGGGTFGIYDSEGNVIQSVERNEKSYALLTMDNVALEEGDVVTIKCTGSSIWLNGDDFIFATTGTYDMVLANKVKVKIDDIAGLTGSDRKTAISNARSAYDALADETRSFVTNYEDLLAAENEVTPEGQYEQTGYGADGYSVNSPAAVVWNSNGSVMDVIGGGEKPSHIVLNVDGEMNIFAADGTAIEGELVDLCEQILKADAIPLIRVDDMDEAQALTDYLDEMLLNDVMVVSADIDALSLVIQNTQGVRGVYDVSAEAKIYSADELETLMTTANSNDVKIILLSAASADYTSIRWLQSRLMTVWAAVGGNDTIENYTVLTNGVDGVVSGNFINIKTALKTFTGTNVLLRVPTIGGHRGSKVGADGSVIPEVTVDALLQATAFGAEAVECDIQPTKDGVLVLQHDDTTNRMMQTNVTIQETNYEDLKDILYKEEYSKDADGNFVERKIDTLEDQFKAYSDNPNAIFYLELKEVATELEEPMVTELRRLAYEYDIVDQCVVITFDTGVMQAMRDIFPEVSLGYLQNDFTQDMDIVINTIESYNGTVNPKYSTAPSTYAYGLYMRGITIHPWTIDGINLDKYFVAGRFQSLSTNNTIKIGNWANNIVVESGTIEVAAGEAIDFGASVISKQGGVIEDAVVTPVKIAGNGLTAGADGTYTLAEGTAIVMLRYLASTDGADANGNVTGVQNYTLYSNPIVISTTSYAAAEGWTVVNENENLTILDENTISIVTEKGDFSGESNATPVDNYWIRTPADEDFTLTVKVSGGMYANYQKAGILVYADDQYVASVVRRYHKTLSPGGNLLGLYQWNSKNNWTEPSVTDPNPSEDVYLKLVKEGSAFTGYYSFDNTEWIELGSMTNEVVVGAEFKIGVYAVQGTKDDSLEVTISDFTYNGTLIPFAETVAGEGTEITVLLDANAASVDEESTIQLNATILPADAAGKTVVWSSSDESIAAVDQTGLVTGITAGTATITASCGDSSAQCVVTVIPFGQTLYISDMEWVSSETDWDIVRRDTGVEGTAISLLQADGTRTSYEKAVSAHAFSKVVIDVEDMGVLRFVSDIGVNKSGGDCGFIVMADDQILYEIGVVNYTDAVKHIDIEIPSETKTITLITNDGGDGITSDHSIWADAHFVMDTTVRDNLRKVTAVMPSYMVVGGTAEMEVSAELVKGDSVDLNEATVTYTSSDENVLSVSDGVITAKSDGVAVVTVSVTLNGITKSASSEVIVGNGDDSLWTIDSPDGELKAIFLLDENGTARYMALENGVYVIEPSELGLVSSIGDFTEGLEFVSVSETTEVVDDYDLYGAKVDHVTAVGNEMTMTFQKVNEAGQTVCISIIARMYDDGLALRYTLDGEGEVSFSSEATTVRFPAASDLYAMDYLHKHETVEEHYTTETISGSFCEPLLYKTSSGTWVLLSEAVVTGEYCGSYLAAPGDGSVNFHFSKEQSGDVVSALPFESPWRFAVIGTAEEINLNTMAENLSPDATEDFSWVESGVTAWTWLNRESTSDGDTYLRYIDFAAEMGWEYVLLDEGWQPKVATRSYRGYYDWFPEVLEHAKEKGVKLLVWAYYKDLMDDEYRDKLFAEWAEMGIAGVKPDIFNNNSQEYMKFYDEIIADTAKHHLLLNLHGVQKTTGERRTYPHMLTREGVFGHEQELFSDKGDMSAYHNMMIPFVRNAVGPADYTPMFSYQNSGSARKFSKAHMASMSVIYETGIQCLADRPEQYLGTEAELYFRDMPAEWDNSFLPVAEPGERIVMVRQHGEDFYVGGMTLEACTYELELSFLGEGTYYAILVSDGDTVEEFNGELMTVTKDTKLEIPMLATGGFAMRIMAEDPTANEILLDKSELLIAALDSDTITATTLKNGEPVKAAVSWSSSDETVAAVSDGIVTGISGGTATITATIAAFDGTTKSASCEVTVTPLAYEPEEGWQVMNADNRENWDIVDENTIRIVTEKGDFSGEGNVNAARNYWVRVPADENFTLTAKVSGGMYANYQKAGIMVYADDQYVASMVRRYHSGKGGNCLGLYQWNSKNNWTEPSVADPDPSQDVYLKLVKEGSTFTGYYSFDNTNWTEVGSATNEKVASAEFKIGVYAVQGTKSDSVEVTISDFTYNGTLIPFAVKNEVPVYSVALSQSEAELNVGEELTLTADLFPDNAYDKTLVWTSSDESVATVEDGKVTAVGGGEATITVTTTNGLTASCEITVKARPHEKDCLAKNFSDVDLNEWYHDAIDFVLTEEMMKGDAEGTFRPVDPITRAEMAQILYNLNGLPEFEAEMSFSDVTEGDWWFDAVMWAASEGLVKGDPEGTYRPEDLITREEMVTIIWRYMGSEKPENAALAFDDAAEVSDWAVEPIAWAVENGVVKGTGANCYEPQANTERAAIAQVMLNIFG